MANLFLRLSLSFACVQVKSYGKKKKETVFPQIVGRVHFEGARIGFLLKYKQKMKKDEPEKTKKDKVISSSFRVCLSLFFAHTSTKNNSHPFKIDPSHKFSEHCFPLPPFHKFNYYTSKRRKKSKKEVCYY